MFWIVVLAYLRRGLTIPPRSYRSEEETQRRLARLFRRYQDGLIPLEQAQRLAYHIRTETEK